jgi:mannan endo-1,6-alpha-mannosidase
MIRYEMACKAIMAEVLVLIECQQAFWAFSAMTAAELNFPDPPPSQPQWLALAQAVFNSQIKRWDTDSCAGGLRWQIVFTNPGWNYKNTISTGGLFQLAARLGRYTGDEQYLNWAEKTWDWLASTPNLTPDFTVNDGSDIRKNCSDANGIQWTYNYGTMLYGAAMMYDHVSLMLQPRFRRLN